METTGPKKDVDSPCGCDSLKLHSRSSGEYADPGNAYDHFGLGAPDLSELTPAQEYNPTLEGFLLALLDATSVSEGAFESSVVPLLVALGSSPDDVRAEFKRLRGEHDLPKTQGELF